MLSPSPDGPHHISQNGPHPQQFVEIVEQPADKVRFRYTSEKKAGAARFPESIVGVNSTTDHKTSPAIKIHNYKGQAVVVVSCVTEDVPHKSHPHNLSGKEDDEKGFKNGVYSLKVDNAQEQVIHFPNLGIQCAKRQDVVTSLKERKSIKVDPFGTGFEHAREPSRIDLNVVRLCFQVFVKDSRHAFAKPLPAVVTTPIHSTRSNHKLQICSLSHASAPVTGDFEMNLLCGKVSKDNIEIHFTETKNGLQVWKGLGKFQPLDVHQQVAIKFRTPTYKDIEVQDPVNVEIRLYRPTDGSYSNALAFIFTPIVKLDLNFRRNSPKILNEDFVSALMQHRNVSHDHFNSRMSVNHPSTTTHSSLPSTSHNIQDGAGGATTHKRIPHFPMQLYASSVETDSRLPKPPFVYGNLQSEESTSHQHPDERLYDTINFMVPLTNEQGSQQEFGQLPHFYTLEEMRPSVDLPSTITTPAPYKMTDMEMDISLSSWPPDSNPDMSTEPSILNVELNSTELAAIECWCNQPNELSII